MVLALAQTMAANAIKIIHGPYLQGVTDTEATIVWLADTTSIGWVELFADDGTNPYLAEVKRYYDTNIGIKREAKTHSVRITGLRPGTTYRYRVFSQQVLSHNAWRVCWGDIAATAAYMKPLPKFKTLDKNADGASFLVVNDIHQRNDVLKKLLSMGEVKKRDMVFFNGDMVNIFDKEDKLFTGFMDTSVSVFASETPLYYVRGNHETRGQMAVRFHEYVCPRQPNLYYTVEQGPVFFICLDTGEDKPDTDLEYSGITDFDRYRDEQAEWLKGVVKSEAFRRAKIRVVIAHIPPFDKDNDLWHGNVEVDKKFIPILNGTGINVMLCGHKHEYEYRGKVEGCDFPIIVNSNNGVITASTKGDKLHVKVQEASGKTELEADF